MKEEEKGPIAFFNKVYPDNSELVDLNYKDLIDRVLHTLDEYDMPTDTFEMNLKTLKISKSIQKINTYDLNANKIRYSDKNILRELFLCACSNDTIGLSYRLKNGKLLGMSLTNGVIDMFTKLNDNSYIVKYPFQKMVSEILVYIYGIDIYKYMFLNDAKCFLSKFKNPKLVIDLMDKLDKYESSKNDKKFYFESCLSVLTELYHLEFGSKKITNFKRFIKNGLMEKNMIEEINNVIENTKE